MRIPKVVKIMGHEYAISMTPRLFASDATSGVCDTARHTITLDENFAESHVAETFLHEILEGLNYHLELELKHAKLNALSEGLFQVLRDNKLSWRSK